MYSTLNLPVETTEIRHLYPNSVSSAVDAELQVFAETQSDFVISKVGSKSFHIAKKKRRVFEKYLQWHEFNQMTIFENVKTLY